MKILSFLSVFVIFLGSFLVFSKSAHAVPPVDYSFAPEIGFLSILEIFIYLFLFLFLPIAFIGTIFKLFGFKKEEGRGWRWNIKQAPSCFLKYLFYHIGLFGLWLIYLQGLKEGSYKIYDYYGFVDYEEGFHIIGINPLESAQLLINDYLISFLIYAVVWALAGHYILSLWRRLRGTLISKSSFWSYARLTLWNIFIVFAAGLVLSIFLYFR